METILLGTTEEDLKKGAEILQNGGLVAFPTETVYGLGANALDGEAVGKVYAAKGRPSDNPMIVHVAEKGDLYKLTERVTADMEKLADAFWPGPLTMVVKARPIVPRVTTGGLDTVAVRMPDHEATLELIRRAGVPLAGPSANLSGHPSPTTAAHVFDDLNDRIDAIIQGGPCRVGIESTVVDMTEENPVILRPGYVTAEDLSRVLGKEVTIDPAIMRRPAAAGANADGTGGMGATGDGTGDAAMAAVEAADFKPKAPGMKYRHYAPKAEMLVFTGSEEEIRDAIAAEKLRRVEQGEKVGVIMYDGDPQKAAHEFFAQLRKFDKSDVDVILAAALEEKGVGLAVMNRMFKSAGYNVREAGQAGQTAGTAAEARDEKMKIALAADHGGFGLKEMIKQHLKDRGIEVKDLGTDSAESVDYPVFGETCGRAVADGKADRGIVVCGSGIGISIAANKVKGIRCALCTSTEMAKLSRQHNDANMLALGGRLTEPETALAIVDVWLDTDFEGGRHQRRVDMLDAM